MNLKIFDVMSLAKQIRTVNVSLQDRGTIVVKILKDSPIKSGVDRVLCLYWKNTAVYYPAAVPEAIGADQVSALGKLVMDLGGTDGPYNLRQRPGVVIGLSPSTFSEYDPKDNLAEVERLAFAHPYLVEWLAGVRNGNGESIVDCDLC